MAKTTACPVKAHQMRTPSRHELVGLALAISLMACLLMACLTIAGCGGDSSSSPSPTPSPQPTPVPGGSFAPLGSTPTMNQARKDATATPLPNGQVLIAGGQDSSGSLSSVELYDPATNSFASAASTPTMNTARSNATATLLPNGKVLIAGGFGTSFGPGGGTSGSLSSVELYDPATNSFASAASLPTMNTPRDGAAAALLPNGKVLIAGGGNLESPLDSGELYDPVTNSFASAASLPTMSDLRSAPTATLLPDGNVLIAGGLEGFTLNIPMISNSVDLYDPTTNSFAAAISNPRMTAFRSEATATLLPNGKVLIAGGIGPGSSGPLTVTLNSVDLYDPASNSFAPAASTPMMNQARTGATATLLNDGLVLIAGGAGGNESIVDLYDPATNSFVPAASTPRMNYARIFATATLLSSGKVLIAGGTGVFGPLNTTDLYTQ